MKNKTTEPERVLLMLYRNNLINFKEMSREQESIFWIALMNARIKEKWGKH